MHGSPLINRWMRRGAGACCAAVLLTSTWAADDQPAQQTLATVKLADHIEIRDVDSASGIAKVEVDVDLTGNVNATVSQIELRNFTVDGVVLAPQPYSETFELKSKETVRKQLLFNTPITPPMAPLIQKFGKKVKASGTAQITAQTHGLLKSKNISSASPFSDDAMLIMPSEQVRGALAKILPLPPMGDASGGASNTSGGTTSGGFGSTPAAGWMTDMTRRGGNNVVIIEASSTVDLGVAKRTAKIYRHGYRYSDTEVIAPLDLQDPVKVVAKNEAGSFGDAIASHVSPGEVHYRGWVRGPHGLTSSDKITGDTPAIALNFKCKLSVGDGSHVDLGVFEFTSRPQGAVAAIDPDNSTGTIAAMQLSYRGLVETQAFNSTTLAPTPVSGSVADYMYVMNPHVTAVAYGSPIFSPQGLLGIVNSDDSAVTAARIQSALLGGCTGSGATTPTTSTPPVVTLPPSTTTIPPISKPTTGTKYHVKAVSTPEGATVWVDHKLALDESGRPITTAASEDQAGTANTATVSKGRHYIAFILDGYKDFGGYVEVDDDLTLSGTLKRN